jgi:hypothetical protein
VVLSRAKQYAMAPDVQCPPEYPEFILERVFYGAEIACDCLGIYSRYVRGSNLMNLDQACDYN